MRCQACGISAIVMIGVLACPAFAQVRLGPQGPEPVKGETPLVVRKDQPRAILLSVDPADEPRPALKYSLWPRVLERQQGNAAPFYYRAFSMMSEVDSAKSLALFELMEASPLELKEANVGDELNAYENVFDAIRTATLREHCDWEWRMQDLEGVQALQFLLPEMQQLRELGRLVAMRARWQIANRQYDQAIASLMDGYQIAINAAQSRSLVSSLVGVATAAMMNEQLLELIQAEDAPNMYWALAELPRPLISIRRALELELCWPDKLFPMFRDAETANHSPEEWRRLFREASVRIAALSGNAPPAQADLMMTALMMRGYVKAKKRLAEQGFSEKLLEQMPAAQVIAIYQSRANQYLRDEVQKWTLLPYHLAWQRQQQTEDRLQREGYFDVKSDYGEVLPITSLLIPALSAARMAEARSTTHLDFLQAIEAIRMYAARHDGQLPNRLDQINAVPIPHDPVTLEEFTYERMGKQAVLEIAASGGRRMAGRWRATIQIAE